MSKEDLKSLLSRSEVKKTVFHSTSNLLRFLSQLELLELDPQDLFNFYKEFIDHLNIEENLFLEYIKKKVSSHRLMSFIVRSWIETRISEIQMFKLRQKLATAIPSQIRMAYGCLSCLYLPLSQLIDLDKRCHISSHHSEHSFYNSKLKWTVVV